MPPPSTVKDIQPPEHLTSLAGKGFLDGALRFGAISFLAHIALMRIHPVYRGLTIQFKAFIQLSSMTLGGCIFAERKVTDFNNMVRLRNRSLQRSQRAWSEEQEIKARIDAEYEDKAASGK